MVVELRERDVALGRGPLEPRSSNGSTMKPACAGNRSIHTQMHNDGGGAVLISACCCCGSIPIEHVAVQVEA
eukprot:3386518-Amphidinium_carterae.1